MKTIAMILISVLFLGSGAYAQELQGVTDTEIKLGAHTVSSGDWGWWVTYTQVAEKYFQMINEQGGINGRKIKYIYYDSQYQAAKALEVTKKLVTQDKVMGMFFSMSDVNIATYKYIESKKVFDFFNADNIKIYTEQLAKTRFALPPSWADEARVLGGYIIEKYKDKKVCLLTVNTPNGKEGREEILKVLKGKVTLGPQEVYDVAAPNANSQVLNLKKAGCEVVYLHHEPPPSAAAVKFAFEQGFKPKWVGISWNVYNIFTETAGKEASEGMVADGFFKLTTDMKDPAVKKHTEFMKKYMEKTPPDLWTIQAQIAAEFMVEVLKRAGRNLTHESLTKAAESINDWTCSLCLSPGSMSPTDHRAIQKLRLFVVKNGQWEYMDDKKLY